MARNKLGLTEGATLALIAAPTDFVLEVPTGVTIVERGPARVVVVFVAKADEVEGAVKSVRGRVEDDGMMWFAYPKGSSKKYTCEFNRDTGWAELAKAGYEPVRVVAIDEDWSALRFRKVEHIKTMTRSFAATEAGKAKAKPKKNR